MAIENEQTLCHIINDGKLLLKRATRGVSKSKWNGLGGKLDYEGEPPEECAKREVLEETGLVVKNLLYHGVMKFYGVTDKTMIVHLFSTREFEGEPKSMEGEEVQWFDVSKIPLSDMWDDDIYWMGYMLSGDKFDAEFHFENKRIVKHSISPKLP